MSIVNDILAEKELKEDANAIAEGITDYMLSKDKAQTTDFILFVVDRSSGRVQFISDMNRDDSMAILQTWIKRELQ